MKRIIIVLMFLFIYNSIFSYFDLFKLSSEVGFISSCHIIKQDIFDLTKKLIYTKIVNGGVNITFQESNVIADFFWKRNLWEIGYISACFFNYSIISFLNNFDKNHFLSWIYINIVNLLEIAACYNSIIFNNNVVINIPIFVYMF